MPKNYRQLKSRIFQSKAMLRKGELIPAIQQIEQALTELGRREEIRTLIKHSAWATELEEAFSLAKIDWYTYRTEKMLIIDLLQDILDDLNGLLQKVKREEGRLRKLPDPAPEEDLATRLENKYALTDRVNRLVRKSKVIHRKMKDIQSQ